ncbi:MAG: ExbD/TolR family protein [Saprospiraceae bacterium]
MKGNITSRPKSPQVDMTPMVDMAFLLVTFFLLATTFKVAEPAAVQIPRSVAGLNLPMTELLTILVDEEGKVFLSMSGQQERSEWLQKYAAHYQLDFTEEEYKAFALSSGFGVPASELKALLALPPEERHKMKQSGIPINKDRNELAEWVIMARVVSPRLRVAVKADRDTPYKLVNDVINTLTGINVLRFNLITQSKKKDE